MISTAHNLHVIASAATGDLLKLQIPSTKLQRSTKHQAPDLRLTLAAFDYWSFSGAWSLVLGAFAHAANFVEHRKRVYAERATKVPSNSAAVSPPSVTFTRRAIRAFRFAAN